ncbi:hypothetical protein [Fibrobacter sp.]|uniref:hypothetical protein n=1 Tax=Fibrobacter sp. TaxID=35828 RepID=UPI00388D332A
MIEELCECAPHVIDKCGPTAYARLRVSGKYYWIVIDGDDLPVIVDEQGNHTYTYTED